MKVGVDSLRTRHLLITSGCTDGMSLLCAEIPVENRNDCKTEQDACCKNLHAGAVGVGQVAERYYQRVLVNADGLVGTAHDVQVDGIQGNLG